MVTNFDLMTTSGGALAQRANYDTTSRVNYPMVTVPATPWEMVLMVELGAVTVAADHTRLCPSFVTPALTKIANLQAAAYDYNWQLTDTPAWWMLSALVDNQGMMFENYSVLDAINEATNRYTGYHYEHQYRGTSDVMIVAIGRRNVPATFGTMPFSRVSLDVALAMCGGLRLLLGKLGWAENKQAAPMGILSRRILRLYDGFDNRKAVSTYVPQDDESLEVRKNVSRMVTNYGGIGGGAAIITIDRKIMCETARDPLTRDWVLIGTGTETFLPALLQYSTAGVRTLEATMGAWIPNCHCIQGLASSYVNWDVEFAYLAVLDAAAGEIMNANTNNHAWGRMTQPTSNDVTFTSNGPNFSLATSLFRAGAH
jgi:hypothetical protein